MLEMLKKKYGIAKLLANWQIVKRGIFTEKVMNKVKIIAVGLDKKTAMKYREEYKTAVLFTYRGTPPEMGEFYVSMRLHF